jgi:hypothetical protein
MPQRLEALQLPRAMAWISGVEWSQQSKTLAC